MRQFFQRWKLITVITVIGLAAYAAPVTTAAIAQTSAPLDCGVAADPDVTPEDDEKEAVLDTIPIGTTWAGHYVDQALLTTEDSQYVGYYDENRALTVGRRSLDSDQWVLTRLNETIGWDSHNYVTLGVDRYGHLHVAGNMHNNPLKYFRTATAGDVTSLVRVPNMVLPSRESSVTYPMFFYLDDGTLVFRYRQGGSGSGFDYYNQYDETTQTWSALIQTAMLDGQGQRNAYAAAPRPGPDGRYHMVWVWRDTPNAATTHTVSYSRSADLMSWETSKGEGRALPITFATSDVADPVPAFGGMINNNAQVGFDASGAPVVAYHKYDEGGNTQVYVARPDDSESGWENVKVSNWTGAWQFSQGGTLVFQVEIYWAPFTLPDGTLRLDVTCQGESRTFLIDGETLEPIEEIVTPLSEPASVTEVRSDYVHDPGPGEVGIDMQVNLNDDSGRAGSFHARRLVRDADTPQRDLLRWESLGENQDRSRPRWPGAQPIEVVILGTIDACKDGGWETYLNPGFRHQVECVAWVLAGEATTAVREAGAVVDGLDPTHRRIQGQLWDALDKILVELTDEPRRPGNPRPCEAANIWIAKIADKEQRPGGLSTEAADALRDAGSDIRDAIGC